MNASLFIPLAEILRAYSTRLMSVYMTLLLSWAALPEVYQQAILAKVDPFWLAVGALLVLFFARVKAQDPAPAGPPPSTMSGVL